MGDHTPTPWRVLKPVLGRYPLGAFDGTNELRPGSADSLEDADLIVSAVNGFHDAVDALRLAVSMLAHHEPGDSRAVSDEFVAIAAVSSGLVNDEIRAVISAALLKQERGEEPRRGGMPFGGQSL